MATNLHDGHRNRLRDEFLSLGENQTMHDHKLLEMLLFYAIPRKDTNPIAHELINTFGSFAGVFDAEVEDLAKIKGMTKNAAVLIKSILPIARAYIESKSDTNKCIKTFEDMGSFFMAKYLGIKSETASMLCLNGKGEILSFEVLSDGDLDSTGLSIRTVLQQVIKTSATAVVIAHNHPSGVALPSPADVEITKMVADALKTISVHLIDHIIIANNDYVSMAQSSKYEHIFKWQKSY